MDVLVKRDVFNDDCTLGNLSVNGKFLCYILEDAYREIEGEPVDQWKIPDMTAIPKGIYVLDITFSNRFGKYLPQIENVPGFQGIRIHGGNTAADTSGCLLLGMEKGERSVLRSQEAVHLFQPMLQDAINAGEKCSITVE